MAKVTFVGTQARVGKGGIMEHRHGEFGWHWACAGHRDEGQIHAAAKAADAKFLDPKEGTAANVVAYGKAFRREVIHKIPSKAKAKVEA